MLDVDVVELSVDETEDDDIKPLTEWLTAWIELIELALQLYVSLHCTSYDRHHVTSQTTVIQTDNCLFEIQPQRLKYSLQDAVRHLFNAGASILGGYERAISHIF